MSGPVRAVGVVVPAHDEQDLLPECLDSLAGSLNHVREDVRTCVCVVADRCTDATESRALARAGRFGDFTLLSQSAATDLGTVRNLGAWRVLHALSPLAPEEIWLLHTDADTVVPSGWVSTQLRYAERGVHAVAGRAVIRRWTSTAAWARQRYEALVADRVFAEHHHHVYGANLGVRADVFVASGGFPAVSAGEDHALWHRLVGAGRTTLQPNEMPVFTSSRTRGRAPGGLATLLHELSTRDHDDPLGMTTAFGNPAGG
ncbi:GT2 family glycosyltransferase [Saccharopolyspora lacisalsi]|uniref:4,4'-diaponeurosporenoate glycosyltransferase n=1 Tax=Halosaccharopolyspora lacisalsi TaxID=1000566 RepID=A0A839E0H1_9PSEU|nr:glycosyltransferase [Halosaccharopolyspora lacisalsi]MBA8824951.1 GT2 family glycosyltransferase [Halosaccharopolyspora lacisalsi]